MSLLFLEYPPCSTCKKAKSWLDAHGVQYTSRHIKDQNPSKEELKAWYQKSGLPLKRFFNTSGLLYKSMALKDKLPSMTEEEQLELLSTDGMLVKRPILVSEDFVLVGFKESEWSRSARLIRSLDPCPGFRFPSFLFFWTSIKRRASQDQNEKNQFQKPLWSDVFYPVQEPLRRTERFFLLLMWKRFHFLRFYFCSLALFLLLAAFRFPAYLLVQSDILFSLYLRCFYLSAVPYLHISHQLFPRWPVRPGTGSLLFS